MPGLLLRVAGVLWLVVFALWFYSFTLPNGALPDGTSLTRSDVWVALPEILLGNVAGEENAGAPSSGWRFFPQRLDLLVVAAAILAGAWGLGRLLLRLIGLHQDVSGAERTVFAFALGLCGLSLLTLGLGLGGWLARGLFGGCLAAFVVIEVGCQVWDRFGPPAGSPMSGPRQRRSRFSWLAVACLMGMAPFLLAMLLGAMLPSTDFDVKEYHLQGPKEFFQNGRIGFLPHNVYTSFPFLTEMLSLLAMVLRGDWYRGALAGKAVLMSFAPLTALALYAAGSRWFGRGVGWLAALVHLTVPWTYRISIIAYAEGGLTFYLFVSLLAVMRALDRSDVGQVFNLPDSPEERQVENLPHRFRRWCLLAGLLAGAAAGCKYPAVITVAIPLGGALVVTALLWPTGRTRWKAGVRAGALFGLGALVTFGPWMLKNTVETGNPVYPLLYSVFGGRDWDERLDAKWIAGHSPPLHLLDDPSKIGPDLWTHVIDVIARSDWQSPLLFGGAVLSLLWWSMRWRVWGLWVYAVWLFLTWWGLTHRIDRFWIPMIPVLSLLAGVGLGWMLRVPSDGQCEDRGGPLNHLPAHLRVGPLVVRWAAALVIVAAMLFNLAFVTTARCGYNEYLIDLQEAPSRTATESMALLNGMELPESARVLLVGEAQVFDARFPHVYNTVFDSSIFQAWCSAAEPQLPSGEQPLHPADDIRQTLREQGITHIFVNWQEILRYRTTYGYTDFVTPQRFEQLVREGVLVPVPLSPEVVLQPVETVADSERQEVQRWAPGPLFDINGRGAFVKYWLFTVPRE